LVLAAFGSFLPGCGGDKDEPEANCADSMKHFLFEGCSLVSDYGIEEGLTAATAWCMAEEALSGECGCSMYFPVVLECFLAASVSNCDACDSVMVDLQNCELQSTCPEVHDCETVMNHVYTQGCVWTNNGSNLSEADAVTNCEAMKQSAEPCYCADEVEILLFCVGRLATGQCDHCEREFMAFDTCMAGCP